MTKLRDELRDTYGITTTEGSDDLDVSGDITHTGGFIASGGFQHSSRTLNVTVVNSATYTVQETDYLIHVTYAGAVTITIPTALATLGRTFEIKDARGASTYNIDIVTEGTEEIDGDTDLTIDVDYNGIRLYSDGTDWWIQSLYTKRIQARVFAYLPTAADTTCTSANTFYPLAGAFTNEVMQGFSLATDKLKYDLDAPRQFEIDWSASLESDTNLSTITIGLSIDGETLTSADPSLIGRYFKTAGESGSLSGTFVAALSKDSTVQIQVSSNMAGTVVTTNYFTTTIRAFSG